VPAPEPPSSTPPPETIPLHDPRREYAELRETIDGAVSEVLASGRYVLGPRLARFEEAVAQHLGLGHAVGVGSGTDALTLALRALGIGPGDEVVTTPFSFVATAEAILRVGARPVFADVRPDTLNLDPGAAAAAVGPRTAGLLPVHLYGQPAEMDALGELAGRHGLALLEDAAQAMGADGVVGARGDAACFSFYPTKNLAGMGDGGLVATDDPGLAARVRRLRHHGRESGWRTAGPDAGGDRSGGPGSGRAGGGSGAARREVGYASRLDELQAAVLSVKLERLAAWVARRREIAASYDGALERGGGVRAPVERPGNRHAYHLYTVRCERRRALARILDAAGVGHGVYYPRPLHLQEPLAKLGYVEGDFPEAERAAREVTSVPVHAGLRETERRRVARALGRAARTLGGA